MYGTATLTTALRREDPFLLVPSFSVYCDFVILNCQCLNGGNCTEHSSTHRRVGCTNVLLSKAKPLTSGTGILLGLRVQGLGQFSQGKLSTTKYLSCFPSDRPTSPLVLKKHRADFTNPRLSHRCYPIERVASLRALQPAPDESKMPNYKRSAT